MQAVGSGNQKVYERANKRGRRKLQFFAARSKLRPNSCEMLKEMPRLIKLARENVEMRLHEAEDKGISEYI